MVSYASLTIPWILFLFSFFILNFFWLLKTNTWDIRGSHGSLDVCTGKYIFIHEIPTRYNYDYLYNCTSIHKRFDMCMYLANEGLGQPADNSSSGWFLTNQHVLEVIFHNRMKRYRCLTTDPSKAMAFYVPYYPGVDATRYLFDQYNISIRDADLSALFKLLRGRPEWNYMGGKDHFLVAGRGVWNLRRAVDDDHTSGTKLLLMPESKNMTILIIESCCSDKHEFAIPYPTFFHPSNDEQVYDWVNKVRRQKRSTLFTFVGAPRPGMDRSIRSEIMEQCNASRNGCKMLECSGDVCLKPWNVMRMFMKSVFCLQPAGDTAVRRSTFDSIVAGCIPVFFDRAYEQYLWHLPEDILSYSVIIPGDDVKKNRVNIESVLSEIPEERVSAMREEVIKLIPKVIYGDPRGELRTVEDAFDLAIRMTLQRIEGLKKELEDGFGSEKTSTNGVVPPLQKRQY